MQKGSSGRSTVTLSTFKKDCKGILVKAGTFTRDLTKDRIIFSRIIALPLFLNACQ